MAEMDENDIIIKISNYLRNVAKNPGSSEPFIVEFAAIDNGQKFPSGTTAKYVEQAVEDAGFEIVRKGATMVSYQAKRKRPVIA